MAVFFSVVFFSEVFFDLGLSAAADLSLSVDLGFSAVDLGLSVAVDLGFSEAVDLGAAAIGGEVEGEGVV